MPGLMKSIPIRHINTTQKEPGISGSFSIRNIQEMLGNKDMIQELHRHDFWFYKMASVANAGK